MEVILTHEQADFDALASLLGASLLYENAVPVLPHKINRNVKAFLNLYSAELPFIEYHDLPKDDIDCIYLVDTQSLVTLKGTTPSTSIQVVDHHQPRKDLPHNWTVLTDKVGASTTLLVEEIREHGNIPGIIYSTLLLLGIYEDTGSLLYASTTSRDIRAAAFLIDQGASLKLAGNFLNPPLSPVQRLLYNQLLEAAETLTIQGCNITICQAEATEMDEEISSVAHKLRDLLDPDALFLIVRTREGIRLIARSTSDQVNVSLISSQFNGGGHERAAAALIPFKFDNNESDHISPQSVRDELITVLQSIIQPVMTVSQVMSRRPMVLKAQTRISEASLLMQRYGYEGFPVVDGNRIVGLLTRRSVDKAVAHKLDLPVVDLMESGNVSVKPGDSIATLQRVMSETGWGQVPVFDPEKGKLVGIVTRTDLLRILTGETKPLPSKKNLANKLEASLSDTNIALLKLIATQATALGYPVYLVGGIVRDLILNRKGADLDIVVEGDAILLARKLCELYGGRQVSHGRFGTAKWYLQDIREIILALPEFESTQDKEELPNRVDLISSRTEFYEFPTALPTIERGSIKLDLHRRDFTINTMALRLDGNHFGELHDFWGGWSDLQNGLIRVLHSLSFIDDPTRLLRAVRFEQRFRFLIEDRTLQLMTPASLLLNQISGQRVRHELDLILNEPHYQGMLGRLEELGLLSVIHPNFNCSPQTILRIKTVSGQKIAPEWRISPILFTLPSQLAIIYLTWLGSYEESLAIAIANRLRLPGGFISCLRQIFRCRKAMHKLLSQTPSHVAAQWEKVSPAALYILDQDDIDEQSHQLIHDYIFTWQYVKPFTDGDTLREKGITPGPVFKTILSALRSAWLDGIIHTPGQETNLLDQLIAQYHQNAPYLPLKLE
jgi:tRNA nucleotidyltransferase (CCA-adding enzyme)